MVTEHYYYKQLQVILCPSHVLVASVASISVKNLFEILLLVSLQPNFYLIENTNADLINNILT